MISWKAIVMSEAIVATFVGGIIALLGSAVALSFEYVKWRKQLRIERLRSKRDKYEILFSKVYASLVTSYEQCLASTLRFTLQRLPSVP
jgi:hypothetical protein